MSSSIDYILPHELLVESLSWLSSSELAPTFVLSRRFFASCSGVLRGRMSKLLGEKGEMRMSFDVAAPADGVTGSYRNPHSLSFSHFEGEEELKDHHTLMPRATFVFSSDLSPYAVPIEYPFETFHTVVWGIWINARERERCAHERRRSRSRSIRQMLMNPYTRGGKSTLGKALVMSGTERIRRSYFAPTEIPHTLTISPSRGPPSFVHTTLLPHSSPAIVPPQDWGRAMPMPGLTESLEILGVQFKRLSVSCLSVLVAHEARAKMQENMSVFVIRA